MSEPESSRLGDPQSPPSVGLQSPNSPGRESGSDDDERAGRKRAASSLTTHERRTANKICRVCGDKAFSYNFNVITCESCKAFFRRNANKEKEIRCPFSEQCEINIVSRRFCQRCRLQKCFNVGMKKEWIMSDEARLEKKQRVEENRERRVHESLVKGKLIPHQLKERLKRDSSTSSSPSASFRSPSALLESGPSTVNSERSHFGSLEGTSLGTPAFRPHPILSETVLGSPVVTDCFTTASTQQIMAQAQLAAAQVQLQQAQIEHQLKQQIVAQQHIVQHQQQQIEAAVAAAASFVPTQTIVHSTALLQPHPSGLHQSLAATLNTNLTHSLMQPLATQMITTPASPMHDPNTVTLPRDVFLQLVKGSNLAQQQHQEKPVKCGCTCQCGRYAPGELIVDEVMKELLAAGSTANSSNFNSSSATSDIPAEPYEPNDLQMEGLLPAAQSSVQWLSTNPMTDGGCLQVMGTIDNVEALKDELYGCSSTSLLEMELHKTRVDPDCCPLTSKDQDRINEVVNSNAVWQPEALDPNEKKKHENKNPNKTQMVNMADGAIRRLIKMTKRIETFRRIPQTDQIKLLKYNCMEYLILRGAMSYDPNENIWKGPTLNSGYAIKMDAMKDAQNMFEHSIRFYSTFKEELRTNEQVMLLLGMCIIFNSDVPGLDHRDLVIAESHAYQRCLKRLLYQLYDHNAQRTQVEFRGLMDKLKDIKELNRRATKMVKDVGADDMEPLLVEMFD